MSVPLYYIKQGSLKFVDKVIFNDLEIYLHAGDRICLVGQNGSGKSSLMKIIAGEYELDRGQVYNNTRIEYLQQEVKFTQDLANMVVGEYVAQPLPEHEKYRANLILEQLQLSSQDRVSQLSGGQLRRTGLAQVLLQEPEILLLDEPTNHLDIKGIEWLEQYIKKYKGVVICISHDRAFLNNITNRIWWLDRGHLKQADFGFQHFEAWQEQLMADEVKALEKLNKKLDAENLWLQQGVTARRKRNQGRLTKLHALRQKLREQDYLLKQATNKYNIPASNNTKRSQFIIEAENLNFSYNQQLMIKNLSLRIKKGEKIGIAGANGSGKTTLIRLLTGELTPDSGNIKRGTSLDITYFDQHRTSLDPQRTLKEILCPHGSDQVILPDGRAMHVAAYLKNFLFDPKLMNAKASILSGGEANRLLLAKALINPGNFLILDEPTNDLDMDSLEMLIEVLSDYSGTLIIVSHDRDFLNRLVTRSLVFTEQRQIFDFIGGYEDYSKINKSNSAQPNQIQKSNKKAVAETPTPTKNSKLSYKYQRLLEVLPNELADLEQKIHTVEQQLTADPQLYSLDQAKFLQLANTLQQMQRDYEAKFTLWEQIENGELQ